jgi:hypothetical protein
MIHCLRLALHSVFPCQGPKKDCLCRSASVWVREWDPGKDGENGAPAGGRFSEVETGPPSGPVFRLFGEGLGPHSGTNPATFCGTAGRRDEQQVAEARAWASFAKGTCLGHFLAEARARPSIVLPRRARPIATANPGEPEMCSLFPKKSTETELGAFAILSALSFFPLPTLVPEEKSDKESFVQID